MVRSATIDELARNRKTTAGRRLLIRTLPFQPVKLTDPADDAPSRDPWFHEPKFYGHPCRVSGAGDAAKTFTRSGPGWSDRSDVVSDAAKTHSTRSALLVSAEGLTLAAVKIGRLGPIINTKPAKHILPDL